ncbi:PepSY domain-containing protein [Pseudoalteromonas sp. S16_S37]|nr:PepSY domain-containing protein [Pseudoalteromonas sp. S16_S37]
MRLSVCFLIFVCLCCTQIVNATDAGKNIDKKQAIELALAQYQGRTLKITEQSDSFVVRILQTDGRVIDIHVDKKTGAVTKD